MQVHNTAWDHLNKRDKKGKKAFRALRGQVEKVCLAREGGWRGRKLSQEGDSASDHGAGE